MLLDHPGHWQQFQLRPDNRGLSAMEMKSKYLHEQFLFEAQMITLNQMHQQNVFMNGGGGGPLPSPSEPTPPPPTYGTEVLFYFNGNRTQVTNDLGWDPGILDNWENEAFGASARPFDVLESGGDETTLIITLRGNNTEVVLDQDAFGTSNRLTRVADVRENCIIEVGSRCFYQCPALSDVFLNNVQVMGDRAFYNCAALESISFNRLTELPNGNNIDGVQQGVFTNCPLSNLDFGGNFAELQVIGDYAFYGCVGFRSIISLTISSIGFRAFAHLGPDQSILEDVSIQCSTNIGDRAFQNNNLLTTISMPFDNIYHIGAFTSVGADGDATFNTADDDDPSFSQLAGWTIDYVS